MFQNDEDYQRGVKYYYGLWDKLCQRTETNWNREFIDRLWHVTEKIWVHINKELKYTTKIEKDELCEDLKILFAHFLSSEKKYHPVFASEVEKVNNYITCHDVQEVQITEVIIEPSLISLMKLGYILSNVAVNLQKNGLCAKEEQEEAENSNEEICDGMGIG
jgi:hypothetical protein